MQKQPKKRTADPWSVLLSPWTWKTSLRSSWERSAPWPDKPQLGWQFVIRPCGRPRRQGCQTKSPCAWAEEHPVNPTRNPKPRSLQQPNVSQKDAKAFETFFSWNWKGIRRGHIAKTFQWIIPFSQLVHVPARQVGGQQPQNQKSQQKSKHPKFSNFRNLECCLNFYWILVVWRHRTIRWLSIHRYDKKMQNRNRMKGARAPMHIAYQSPHLFPHRFSGPL